MKKIQIILLVICIVLSLSVTVVLLMMKGSYNNSHSKCEYNHLLIKEQNDMLKQTLLNNYLYEDLIIGGACFFNNKEEVVHTSSLVGEELTMFVYMHSPKCPPCLDMLSHLIKQHVDSINIEKIIFFGKFKSKRDMLLIKQMYPIITRLYNTNDKLFNQIEKPLIFLMDNSSKMQCVHFVEKTMPEISKSYFKLTEKKMKNKSME